VSEMIDEVVTFSVNGASEVEYFSAMAALAKE
jgi:hypothetical protein